MSKEITYSEQAAKAVAVLSKGAFLTVSSGGRSNVMTIGWGNIGFMWGKPVFTVMVRPSRYTYQFLEASGEFTVSLPLGDMGQALALCGAKSGRDMNKVEAAALTLQPGQKVGAPVVAGCGLYYECKVLFKGEVSPTGLMETAKAAWYAQGDYHTVYVGEIVAAYMD